MSFLSMRLHISGTLTVNWLRSKSFFYAGCKCDWVKPRRVKQSCSCIRDNLGFFVCLLSPVRCLALLFYVILWSLFGSFFCHFYTIVCIWLSGIRQTTKHKHGRCSLTQNSVHRNSGHCRVLYWFAKGQWIFFLNTGRSSILTGQVATLHRAHSVCQVCFHLPSSSSASGSSGLIKKRCINSQGFFFFHIHTGIYWRAINTSWATIIKQMRHGEVKQL